MPKTEFFTADHVISRLNYEVKQAGSARAWAAKAGVDAPALSTVMAGRAPPSQRVANALGYAKVVLFVPYAGPRLGDRIVGVEEALPQLALTVGSS